MGGSMRAKRVGDWQMYPVRRGIRVKWEQEIYGSSGRERGGSVGF
jgi:hypothetical protein